MIARRPVLAGFALAMLGGHAVARGKAMEDPVPFGMIGKMLLRRLATLADQLTIESNPSTLLFQHFLFEAQVEKGTRL